MKAFAKLLNMLSFLAIGYFLMNILFGLSTISYKQSILALVFSYIVSVVTAKYIAPSTPNERELNERVLLFNKIHTQLIQALDKQAELVYVVVVRRMHPKAGVYYDVSTATDYIEAESNAENE